MVTGKQPAKEFFALIKNPFRVLAADRAKLTQPHQPRQSPVGSVRLLPKLLRTLSRAPSIPFYLHSRVHSLPTSSTARQPGDLTSAPQNTKLAVASFGLTYPPHVQVSPCRDSSTGRTDRAIQETRSTIEGSPRCRCGSPTINRGSEVNSISYRAASHKSLAGARRLSARLGQSAALSRRVSAMSESNYKLHATKSACHSALL